MPRLIEGHLTGGNRRFAIVTARFNEAVTERLLRGALDCLKRHGVAEDRVTVIMVPGSFEILAAARAAVKSGEYDGMICLGALVRGETPHFDVLASAVAGGLARLMDETGLPVAFGVLTCDNMGQALDRAGGKAGNKGWDAALVALEMADLMTRLGGEPGKPVRG